MGDLGSPGKKDARKDGDEYQKLRRRSPLHKRETPARVLENHCLVHHRELKMRCGVVDWVTGVLREERNEKGGPGKRERQKLGKRQGGKRWGHCREVRRAGEERDRGKG